MADYVPEILKFFEILCCVVLAFYLLRVLAFIFQGKNGNDPHRLREAMATAYTVIAAYFILQSTKAIHPFVNNIVNAGTLVSKSTPSGWIYALLIICAGVVCVAFICNFSRSLWMLKSLDHAVFEPVPEWDTLSDETRKRVVEFFTRTMAAFLFILLEYELKKLADTGTLGTSVVTNFGTDPQEPIKNAGLYGMFLYGSLICWWFSGRWIASSKMPKKILFFYAGGLLNSLFIYLFGGKTSSQDKAILLLLIVIVATMAASYMLYIVFHDLYSWLKNKAQPLWKGKGRQPPIAETMGH